MQATSRRNKGTLMTDTQGLRESQKDDRQVVIYTAPLLCRLKELAARRLSQLNDSQMLQQFYRDVDEEEAWIK